MLHDLQDISLLPCQYGFRIRQRRVRRVAPPLGEEPARGLVVPDEGVIAHPDVVVPVKVYVAQTQDEIEALVAGKVLTFGTKKVEEESTEEKSEEKAEKPAEEVAEVAEATSEAQAE